LNNKKQYCLHHLRRSFSKYVIYCDVILTSLAYLVATNSTVMGVANTRGREKLGSWTRIILAATQHLKNTMPELHMCCFSREVPVLRQLSVKVPLIFGNICLWNAGKNTNVIIKLMNVLS